MCKIKTDYNIAIVVVSYHNAGMTKRYVCEELVKLSIPYTLVVVNNDSTEEESRKLADDCHLTFVTDDVNGEISAGGNYLIWSKDNLGYARGNNKAIRFLNRIGGFTHFLFSNDDIEIKHSDILQILASIMEGNNDIGAIGPRVVGLDGRDQSPHDSYVSPYRLIGWKLLPFLRRKNKKQENELPTKPSSRYTYWVQGSFMLVDACSFMEVGMFDEETFLYYEEPILAERLLKIKKRMYFASDVEIVHFEGGSTKRNKKRDKIEMDSCVYYMKQYKHVPEWVLWLLKCVR